MQMVLVLAAIVLLSLLSILAPDMDKLLGEITSGLFLLLSLVCVLLYLTRSWAFPLPALLQIPADIPAEQKAQTNTRLLLIATATMAVSLILLWVSRM